MAKEICYNNKVHKNLCENVRLKIGRRKSNCRKTIDCGGVFAPVRDRRSAENRGRGKDGTCAADVWKTRKNGSYQI